MAITLPFYFTRPLPFYRYETPSAYTRVRVWRDHPEWGPQDEQCAICHAALLDDDEIVNCAIYHDGMDNMHLGCLVVDNDVDSLPRVVACPHPGCWNLYVTRDDVSLSITVPAASDGHPAPIEDDSEDEGDHGLNDVD